MYLVEPRLFGLLAVLDLVPQVDRLLALKKFVDATVDKSSVQILERVLDVPGGMQLIPHPRFLHVTLILLHYFWRIESISWISQRIEHRIARLNARLDSRMRAFDLQHVHEASTAAHQHPSWKCQFWQRKISTSAQGPGSI